jgi:hypothetical protein
MTEKIQGGIEAYRQAVIDNTFNPELVSESEEVDTINEQFYVYDHDDKTNKIKKRFATNAAATKHAEKLGGNHKVASREYWHDRLNPSNPNAKNESEEFDLSEFTLEEIQDFMASEDFASLDELSKKTLSSYVKRAAMSAAEKAHNAGVAGEKGQAATPFSQMATDTLHTRNKLQTKAMKRIANIGKASDKLAKDESEEVSELSKSTLASYVKKATGGLKGASTQAYMSAVKRSDDKEASEKSYQTAVKRINGVSKAVDKLAKD